MYLLGTVVLSELRKRDRNGEIIWSFPASLPYRRTISPDDLFISVISIGEIERGIERQQTIDPAFAAA